MKKGIALLITVSLVATIVALIGISAGIIDDSFKRISNKQFMIQANTMLSGFIDILDENAADINDSTSLDIFLSMPFSFEQKSRDLSVDIYFLSDAAKPNINNMLESSEANSSKKYKNNPPLTPEYERFFDRILSIYNVSDKITLLYLIADSVDTDTKERQSGTEIALEDPFFTQGHIYSMRHFQKILDAYKRITLDYSVDAIPWESLIGFANEKVDFNNIDDEVLKYIFSDIDPDFLRKIGEESTEIYEDFKFLNLSKEQEAELKDFGIDFFSPQVRAFMNISNGESSLKISFRYDLRLKKVSDIAIVD